VVVVAAAAAEAAAAADCLIISLPILEYVSFTSLRNYARE